MKSLYIEGGHPLSFTHEPLKIAGFKHAWVVTLCSTVLFPEIEFHFTNVPAIKETEILNKILSFLGARCELQNDAFIISTKSLTLKAIPSEWTQEIHGALYLFPALLARFGEAVIGECGGCAIGDANHLGSRPFDHMMDVLTTFGYEVSTQHQSLVGRKISINEDDRVIDIQHYSDFTHQLSGPKISGATKTAILVAITHGKKVTILNPYLKPDVTEFIRLLRQIGYLIDLQPNAITIHPLKTAMPKQIRFDLLGDVSVLMTYMTLAVLSGQPLTIQNERMKDLLNGLKKEIEILQQMGIKLFQEDHKLHLMPPTEIMPVHIDVLSTSIYSDHQPFFALMLSRAKGMSSIREYVWVKRFAYANELKKLGYHFEIQEEQLLIYPSTPDVPIAHLTASDLRAAAVLLLAACLCHGKFYLLGYHHLIRGYENLIGLLRTMGASIKEVYVSEIA